MISLSKFIDTERERYDSNDNNLFAFSLIQALRYHEFLLVVAKRHLEASQAMMANHRSLKEALSGHVDGQPMAVIQMRLFAQMHDLTTIVHLEIESFYLFAKILLDKIALFLQRYFGPAQGISLVSHDKLLKNYDQYIKVKGLVMPDTLPANIRFLKEHICDYRDKQISHLQNPRVIRGTSYGDNGQTRIAFAMLNPKPGEVESQAESKEVPELLCAIDEYIQQIVEAITVNRGKTIFSLKLQE